MTYEMPKSAVIDYTLLFPGPNQVVLSTTIDFCPKGLKGAQEAMGDYINKVQLAGGSMGLAPVFDEISRMPGVQDVASAYRHLSPESYAGVMLASYNTTTQYLQTVNSRMQGIRSNGMTSGSALRSDMQSDKRLLLAYSGPDASIAEFFDGGQNKQAPQNYGVWINGFGKWGDQKGADGFTGFNYLVSGGAFGLDFLVGDRVLVGLSGGESYTGIDLDNTTGSGHINSTFTSLYGSYFTKKFYLETALGYSRQRLSNNRNVFVGSLLNTVHSEHSGDVYSASLEGGYNFNLGTVLIQPVASLQYINLSEQGFRETGAGSLNLIVGSRSTDSLTSDLGFRVAKMFRTGFGNLIPELRVAWKHDFELDDRVVSAAFEGAPNIPFAVKGQAMNRDGAEVSAGMTLVPVKGLSLNLKYDAELRNDYNSNGLFGELRVSF